MQMMFMVSEVQAIDHKKDFLSGDLEEEEGSSVVVDKHIRFSLI